MPNGIENIERIEPIKGRVEPSSNVPIRFTVEQMMESIGLMTLDHIGPGTEGFASKLFGLEALANNYLRQGFVQSSENIMQGNIDIEKQKTLQGKQVFDLQKGKDTKSSLNVDLLKNDYVRKGITPVDTMNKLRDQMNEYALNVRMKRFPIQNYQTGEEWPSIPRQEKIDIDKAFVNAMNKSGFSPYRMMYIGSEDKGTLGWGRQVKGYVNQGKNRYTGIPLYYRDNVDGTTTYLTEKQWKEEGSGMFNYLPADLKGRVYMPVDYEGMQKDQQSIVDRYIQDYWRNQGFSF